jgi:hypothetical protein
MYDRGEYTYNTQWWTPYHERLLRGKSALGLPVGIELRTFETLFAYSRPKKDGVLVPRESTRVYLNYESPNLMLFSGFETVQKVHNRL